MSGNFLSSINVFSRKIKSVLHSDKKESDKLLRLLHEDTLFALLILHDDVIVDCNKKSQDIFGCGKNKIIGRSVTHFFCDDEGNSEPTYERFSDHLTKALNGYTQVFEWRIKKADGTPTDTYISLKMVDTDGEQNLGAIIQEITPIRKNQWLSRLTKTVADTIETPVFLIQLDGICRYVNDQVYREFGYTKDEMLSMPISIIVPEFSEEMWAEQFKTLKKEKKLQIEIIMKRRNGEEYWAEMRASLLNFEGEEFFFAYSHDLSDRKMVEEALSIREERYRLLIEKVPSVIYTTNQYGKRIFISSNIEQIYGYTPEEIYESGDEVWTNRIHPEDVVRVKNAINSLFMQNTSFDIEYRIRRKDNRWIWLSDKATVTVELDGNPKAYGIISDFTDWKESENALAESESKFRSLSEESPNMIFIFKEGKIVFVNNKCSDIIGYTKEEVYDSKFDFFSLFTMKERSKAKSEFNSHLLGNEAGPSEYTFVTKNNEKMRVIINTKLIEFDSKSAILGIVTDVTERILVEEFLRESEKRYRTIFESAAIGVFSTDLKGRFLEVNQALQDMLGYSSEDFQDLNLIDLAHSEDRKGVLICFEELVTGKRNSYQLEIKHIHKDTSTIWNKLTASLVKDTLNKPSLIIGMCEDISEQKKTQAKLIKSEETYRLLIENAQEGVIGLNKDGTILLINKSAVNFLGQEPKDYMGKHLNDIFPDNMARGWLDCCKKVLDSGKSATSELSFKGPYDKDYWIQSSAQPLRHNNGDIYGVLILNRNITRQKKAEDQLRNSELWYRNLFESMAQGAVYQDSTGKIFSINPAALKILGVNQIQILGKNSIDIYATGVREDGSRFKLNDHPARLALKTGKRVTNTIMGIYNQKKKKRVWILIDTVPQFKGKKKKPDQVFTTFTDITESKKSEDVIKESREQLRALTKHLHLVREEEIKTISREIHDELGQMLTALKMNLSLIGRELIESNRFISEPEQLISEINEMTKLADSTLKQVKNIITRLRPEVLDNFGPVAALKWAAKQFQIKSGISCEISTTQENISLEKERSIALFRIFQEALTNITRHSQATEVQVKISSQKDSIFLNISDNGLGITKQQIEKPDSFGILGMKERALYLGGNLRISGKRNKGTSIKLVIPLNGSEK